MAEILKDHENLTDSHCYITTQSGRRLALPELHVNDVSLRDVVHALSMQCRFNGHVRDFYSVAEHSVLVANLAERDHGFGSDISRCALLHDAVEAYVGDFPAPLKRVVTGFKEFETKVEVVVRKALRLPDKTEVWEAVHVYDQSALFLEGSYLFTPPPPWVREVDPRYHHPILCLTPRQAAERLTWRLKEYGYDV